MKGEITMKATGIVRRVDDLGRVVIPKEIRRTASIREGDPLEIFLDEDGAVVFRKYNPTYRDDLIDTLQNAAYYYDNYEDDRAIAEQLRKIAKEVDALLP